MAKEKDETMVIEKTGKAEAEQLCEKSESQWSETTGDNNNEVTALPAEDSLQT